MLKSQEIQLAQSKRRERMAAIQKADEINDDGRAELRKLADDYEGAEVELRAALLLEDAEREQIKEPDNVEKNFSAECRDFDLASLVEALEGQRVIEGREAEVIQELEVRNGKASRGIYLPWEALENRADATVTTPDSSGGKLASRSTMNALERLFEQSSAQSFGVQTIQVTGKPRFPEMTAGASASWVAEGSGADAAAITTAVKEPTLRTLTARYLLTRQAIRENSALEPLLRRDLSEVIREALDLAFFQGTGADEQPAGLENLGNVTALDHEGAVLRYHDVVDWITEIMVSAKLNGMSNVHVAGVPFMLAALLKTSFGDGYTQHDMVQKLTSNLVFSNQVSDIEGDTATAYIGATKGHAYVPMWGAPELIVDPYSESKTGKVALTVFTFPDVLVQRQDTHFLKVTNIAKGE
ncbi:phage major capsid protein [Leisingera caerulea]|uniref:Phage major capsid protein n=1 Tax=Leisingera caerulea TaxID=506591 RepID=A0A9Q9HDH1_LEICA|nr:phage major capsid protein [Leisingera caerulea]UWQ52743.1 phage major capsid protein [Leisingera caerulea]